MFVTQKKIPPVSKYLETLPMTEQLNTLKREKDTEIRNVLFGTDKRKLFIVGPCSANDPEAVTEYAEKISEIFEKTKDVFVPILRVYTSKPRSLGVGYRGLMTYPETQGNVDFEEGIYKARKLHIDVLKNFSLPTADEMLYPEWFDYISDTLSYVAVGARSVENDGHRLVASGLELPVGMKTPMNGNMQSLADSVYAVRNSQEFFLNGNQVKSNGNALSHAVLRGYIDADGTDKKNYYPTDVEKFTKECSSLGITSPVIIDCSHSNSEKNPEMYEKVAFDVVKYMVEDESYRKTVKGLMLESYLFDGASKNGEYGVSFTDPCLGLQKTEKLILSLAEKIEK